MPVTWSVTLTHIMRISRWTFAASLPLAFVAVAAFAQTTPVADRVAAQNKLFDEYYETGLRESPERATAVGDYRFNDKLDDVSLAAITRRHETAHGYLVRLRMIDPAGMPEQDLLSHQLLERALQNGDESFQLKDYEMPVNQQNGIHTELADLPLSMPFDSVKHYEDYIARLHAIPVALQQTTEVLRAGERDNLMPVQFLIAKLPGQCDGIIAQNPFAIPLRKFPASFSEADKQRLTTAINTAVQQDVFPAYRTFATFLRTEYLPKGRTTLSVESLPDGKHRYEVAVRRMTTTKYTPEQIHEIGLREVARITALQTTIAKQQGYPDLASFRAALAKDPRWIPTSQEQIVDDFRKYIAQMQPKLPQLFNLLPKSPVTVEPIPEFQAAAATHYQTGTPDGKRPGRVSVAVSDYAHRTLVLDEAVAYHEGIPGHHMQLSVQQQLTGLPKFRQHGGGGSTAFVEGWALYAEELGKEVGFYQNPVSDYGRLNSELFRAVRLVVDTGIHHYGWSRDQVIRYMTDNDVNGPLAQTETDRYIAWPGQALAYKMGQLKIRELREEARTQLGDRFDIRSFHDEVLNGGAMPLDLLQERVEHWIGSQRPVLASK
ncbi:DUF885 domain-containing protein [Terriglobus aquaticus]